MWRLFQPLHQDMAIQMIVFSFHGDLQPLQGSCKHPQNGNGFSCKPGCHQWLRLTHDRWKDDSPSTPGRKTADVLDDISSLHNVQWTDPPLECCQDELGSSCPSTTWCGPHVEVCLRDVPYTGQGWEVVVPWTSPPGFKLEDGHCILFLLVVDSFV